MKTAMIALGSNLDQPVQQIRAACARLQQLPHSRVLKISSLYRSTPVGYLDQPDFINAVLMLETSLDPYELLAQLQQIEEDFGRVRSFTNAPRTLDLDVIDYEGVAQDDPHLILPHPRAVERVFVMRPLAEITPDYCLHGQSAAEIAETLGDDGIVRLTAETALD